MLEGDEELDEYPVFIETRVMGGELPEAIEVFLLRRRACCRKACLPDDEL